MSTRKIRDTRFRLPFAVTRYPFTVCRVPNATKPVDNPAVTVTDGCPHCRGTGWEDGPDEWEVVAGEPHRYTTVIPCRHLRPPTRERHDA
jgi:hypothetical protein